MTELEPTSMNGEIGIIFVVQSKVTGILSAAWNIRSHRTTPKRPGRAETSE